VSRDLRRYAHNTNAQLLIGFFLILIVVGEGLIYIMYGRDAALLGLLCILGTLVPLALIGLVFLVIKWILKRADQD
jgi:hypothetical protein